MSSHTGSSIFQTILKILINFYRIQINNFIVIDKRYTKPHPDPQTHPHFTEFRIPNEHTSFGGVTGCKPDETDAS